LNSSVSTVEWNKKGNVCNNPKGIKSYKPKRDENEIIICKSEVDCESMLYADGVRKLRQREYDHADLYSDSESAQAERNKRLQHNFIDYFEKVTYKRHANTKTKSLPIELKMHSRYFEYIVVYLSILVGCVLLGALARELVVSIGISEFTANIELRSLELFAYHTCIVSIYRTIVSKRDSVDK
jgi:hypothetical protein